MGTVVATAKTVPSSSVITPAGVEIAYFSAPKRKYEIRGDWHGHEDWKEVPSVTKILEVLNKPALVWWGMKVGVEGLLKLMSMGSIIPYADSGTSRAFFSHDLKKLEKDDLVKMLTDSKLTVNHVRDKAGVRGHAVHQAFEAWANEGILPVPEDYVPEERGYILGLKKFLDEVNPESVDNEVMVGSLEHGYAGRYDGRIRINEECEVVVKTRKKDYTAVLKPSLLLIDVKSSKGVYHDSHSRQLEAYELASVECGYEQTDARGILHVTADGAYEFVRSTAEARDFLAVLEVWKSEQRMKERKK
jgi:hypothetical protein